MNLDMEWELIFFGIANMIVFATAPQIKPSTV